MYQPYESKDKNLKGNLLSSPVIRIIVLIRVINGFSPSKIIFSLVLQETIFIL